MATNPKKLPSIPIDEKQKKAIKIKAAQEGITLTDALRSFVKMWARGDPSVAPIIEEAKKK